jgi:GNAT superfamily N-acetyltransferase
MVGRIPEDASYNKNQAQSDLDLAVSYMRRGQPKFARQLLLEIDGELLRAGGVKPSKPAAPREPAAALAKPDSSSFAEKIKTKTEKFKERIKKQRELGKKTASEKAQENYRALDIDYIKDLIEAGGDDPNDLITKGIEQWAKGVLQHDITSRDGQKYKSKVNQIYFTGDRISMYGGIEDSNGNEIGNFHRTLILDKKHVYHNSFFMDADQQGNGVGSAFIQASEHLYRQAGFKTVGVTGVSDSELNDEGNLSMTGATTWPQQGFNWLDDIAKAEFLRTIKSAVEYHADNWEYFDRPEQAKDLLAMVEEAEKQSLGSANAIHPGLLVDWRGAARYFGDEGAQIGYLKKLDDN